MLARVHSGSLVGIDAYPVEVEVDVYQGLPSVAVVGLPDNAVKESAARVKSAIVNSGYPFPARRITVNLAPADLRKEGSGFDLPIALGILAALNLLPSDKLKDYIVVGELALDGRVKSVRGALSLGLAARDLGFKGLILPEVNAAEAAVTAADERPWLRHYEEGVPPTIAVPDVTLPELLDRTAARAPGKVALRFFLDPRMPVPALTWAAAARADPALRDRPLPARRAQGRPGRDHAAELPGVRGRLLRRPADRRDPGQHEPDVRRARDARAVRRLGLRDAGAPRPVLPAPAGDPRRDPRPPRDRGGPDREPAVAGPLARSPRPVAPRRAREGPGRDGRLLLPRAPPRLPADASRGEPPADRRGPPAVHRRHDGHAEGRDAHPPQPRRQRPPGPVLVPARCGRSTRSSWARCPSSTPTASSASSSSASRRRPRSCCSRARGPDAVLEALHRFRPTLFPGVPTLYAGIIDHPRVGEYDLRTGTQCLSGAAPLPARARGALRGAHRRPPRRGLRPHRDLAAHPRQPDPRRAPRREHRRSRARAPTRGSWTSRPASRSRPGARASSRCAGPRSCSATGTGPTRRRR